MCVFLEISKKKIFFYTNKNFQITITSEFNCTNVKIILIEHCNNNDMYEMKIIEVEDLNLLHYERDGTI